MNPIQLQDQDTLELIGSLPDHMLQARRMVEYLSKNPKAPTGHVSQHCAIGNLSDVARNVNQYLYKKGLMVGCEKPLTPIINKFSEQSNQFLWSIYKLPPAAANDSVYLQVGKSNEK